MFSRWIVTNIISASVTTFLAFLAGIISWSVCCSSDYLAFSTGWQWIINCNVYRTKLLWPNLSWYYIRICLEGLRRTTKISMKIPGSGPVSEPEHESFCRDFRRHLIGSCAVSSRLLTGRDAAYSASIATSLAVHGWCCGSFSLSHTL
jgi:hypothetical protein